jgi:Bacterial PH domain
MFQTAESVLAPHLDPGERLLWSGQPRSGIRFRAQDAFLIPFSILWCGFAIFWETSVVRTGAPVFFMLWGIPFVCAGLFFVFGRFITDARSRSRTFYGVTSERILIVSGIFSRQTKSLQLRTLSDVSLTQRGDGSGTITFGPSNYMNSLFPAGAWPGTGRYVPPSFDLIECASEVYDVIRGAQRTRPANA